MYNPTLPYSLKSGVLAPMLAMAAESDVFLIGEIHGTQEMPMLALRLLPELALLGYGGLAMELQAEEREALIAWTKGGMDVPRSFGPYGFRDGRSNVQVLSLIQQALRSRWHLICFDTHIGVSTTWAERDRTMAGSLLEQWDKFCPKLKILGICGNLHSRITEPAKEYPDMWPSFAKALQQMRPDIKVRTINVIYNTGEFYNGGLHQFEPKDDCDAPLWIPKSETGHSADLILPCSTAATFIDS